MLLELLLEECRQNNKTPYKVSFLPFLYSGDDASVSLQRFLDNNSSHRNWYLRRCICFFFWDHIWLERSSLRISNYFFPHNYGFRNCSSFRIFLLGDNFSYLLTILRFVLHRNEEYRGMVILSLIGPNWYIFNVMHIMLK